MPGMIYSGCTFIHQSTNLYLNKQKMMWSAKVMHLDSISVCILLQKGKEKCVS